MKTYNTDQLLLSINFLLEDAELLQSYIKDKQFTQAELIYNQISTRLNRHHVDMENIMEILRKYNLLVDLVAAYERSDEFVQD